MKWSVVPLIFKISKDVSNQSYKESTSLCYKIILIISIERPMFPGL